MSTQSTDSINYTKVVFPFTLPTKPENRQNCPICLEAFDQTKEITGHIFENTIYHAIHLGCIQESYNKGNTKCPECSKKINHVSIECDKYIPQPNLSSNGRPLLRDPRDLFLRRPEPINPIKVTVNFLGNFAYECYAIIINLGNYLYHDVYRARIRPNFRIT